MNHVNRTQNIVNPSDRSLHKLIYCSLATPDLEPAEIQNIISAAKHNNPRFDITGFLVYGSGIFFQWLEGPKDNVTNLMKLIIEDPWHLNVVVLSQEDEIRERLFPDWDMALVETTEFKNVLENALKESSDDKLKQILSMFLTQLHIT